MSPALERGLRKALRTLAQMAASGGLTALVTLLADGLEPKTQAMIGAAWMFVVTFLQNAAETGGLIPVLLPTAGVLSHVGGGLAEGTVEAVVEVGGQVVGDVVDMAGQVIGDVTGQITPDKEEDT